MLLTITTTHRPATALGYLLHKHPDRLQSFPLAFGQAHVCYPEATEERCTAALVLDVDPVGLVRGRDAPADQYVNDRPYVASSFLSVAIAQVFGSALAGKSAQHETLVETPLPLVATLAVLPCRGGEVFLRRLFEPLGYAVVAARHPLDPTHPEWGESAYFTVRLSGTVRLRDLLTHLYVLVPVLDDDKHYYVGEDEIDKLLRRGAGWLAAHPEREAITARYLKRRRGLIRDALARLTADEDTPDETDDAQANAEIAVVPFAGLHQQRAAAVLDTLRECSASRVLDLGCGEGVVLRMLLEDRRFTEIVGMDVSFRALEHARERLHLDRMPEAQRSRLTLLHGSLTYRDARLAGYDAAVVMEVIEHLDPPRLAAFGRVLFDAARPGTVVLTTPNREYNVLFPALPTGQLRHRDHRFEWTRAEFAAWAGDTADRFGYAVRFVPVGPEDDELGPPSQMAVFTRQAVVSRRLGSSQQSGR